jgi:hypothetical protein
MVDTGQQTLTQQKNLRLLFPESEFFGTVGAKGHQYL